ELREQWVRTHAGGPHERARRDARAVAERDLVGGDRVERRADVDLDPAVAELPGGVVAEARRDLRQDLRCRIHEHPPPRRVPEAAAGRSGVKSMKFSWLTIVAPRVPSSRAT